MGRLYCLTEQLTHSKAIKNCELPSSIAAQMRPLPGSKIAQYVTQPNWNICIWVSAAKQFIHQSKSAPLVDCRPACQKEEICQKYLATISLSLEVKTGRQQRIHFYVCTRT